MSERSDFAIFAFSAILYHRAISSTEVLPICFAWSSFVGVIAMMCQTPMEGVESR